MPRKKTFKKRILGCIGDQKPTPWGLSIGLGSGTITRIFKDDKIPTWRHLVRISKALNKSIDWLLTGENYCDSLVERIGSHKEVITTLVDILDGTNKSNVTAIERCIDAFYLTKDIAATDTHETLDHPKKSRTA